jgi:cobalt-zinc-cadmium efflux system membrane fusion protein
MTRARWAALALSLAAALIIAGCNGGKSNPAEEAPPPLQLERVGEGNIFKAEKAEQFALATATEREATPALNVTGVIAPDISRAVPVISIATGRVVQISARLGDIVEKGQLLLKVQSADIAGAFSDYRKAVADEKLTAVQLERSRLLYDRGAISQNDLQVAQDTEDKAKVDVETTADKLRIFGNQSLDHPSSIVDIRAPISGIITDQQVTNAAGVAGVATSPSGLGAPSPFTITSLDYVWILCDVYENDLADVHVGETADIRLNAYPEQIFTGTISNIGTILDPNIRAVKVRIEVRNPGVMRPGMFVTATFHGRRKVKRAVVPADAVLHLHDRDWVYIPQGNKEFRRVEVVGGNMVSGGMQEIISGIEPGQQVVANALAFQSSVEQ